MKSNSKIPYIFLVFFGVIIVVNFAYIYIAKKTWSGLVTEDSYQTGLNYNDTLKQAEEQKKLGWIVDTNPQHLYDNKFTIYLRLKDEKFVTINDASIGINFKRPSQSGQDFEGWVKFTDGVYKVDVEFPLKGQWDFEIYITAQGKKFKKVERHLIQW